MKPLRVAVLGSALFGFRSPFAGGMEVHTWDLVDGLRRRGHQVTVYAGPDSDPDLGSVAMWDGDLKLSGAARRDVSFAAEDVLAEHVAYQRTLLRLMRDRSYDLVHLNCVHQLPVAMAGMLPTPVTATLHCPPTPWLELAYRVAREDGAAPCAVAVSEHLSRHWDEATGWAPPVLPNGVDLELWRPQSDVADYLVWSGRMVPEKAPHLAIETAQLLGLPLVLAGPAYDPEYFTTHIEPHLGPDVVWRGHLGRAELAALVRGARTALVTPAWEEPFGLVAIEAMASGTPVAAVARGALPDLVDEQVGALALADATSLAEATESAMRRDRAAVRARAEDRHDLRDMVARYAHLFQGAVRKRLRGEDGAA